MWSLLRRVRRSGNRPDRGWNANHKDFLAPWAVSWETGRDYMDGGKVKGWMRKHGGLLQEGTACSSEGLKHTWGGRRLQRLAACDGVAGVAVGNHTKEHEHTQVCLSARGSTESWRGLGCKWGLALHYRKIIMTQVWNVELRKVRLEAGRPFRKPPDLFGWVGINPGERIENYWSDEISEARD